MICTFTLVWLFVASSFLWKTNSSTKITCLKSYSLDLIQSIYILLFFFLFLLFYSFENYQDWFNNELKWPSDRQKWVKYAILWYILAYFIKFINCWEKIVYHFETLKTNSLLINWKCLIGQSANKSTKLALDTEWCFLLKKNSHFRFDIVHFDNKFIHCLQ